MRKKIKLLTFFTLLLVFLFVIGCKPKADKITIKGSTTVLPIAQATAEEFMMQNSKIRLSVQGGGSSVGISSIIDGTADIGDASRSAKEKEIKNAKDNGVDLTAHVVAMDGLAVVVNNENPIDELTIAQIRKMYKGEITNWKEVGGKDAQIVMVNRDTSSGTFETFHEIVMKKEKSDPRCLTVASNKAAKTTIVNTPGAIGYVGIGYIDSSLKDIKVNGIKISKEKVLNKEYPIARELYMYTKKDISPSVEKFLEFVKSSEGQKIVERTGFIGLN